MKVPRTPSHAAKTVPASKTSAPVGMTTPNPKAASSALAGVCCYALVLFGTVGVRIVTRRSKQL